MEQKCIFSGKTFTIHPDEEEFLAKMTFTFGDTVIHPPKPVIHPDRRRQIRTCHRNEQYLYKVKSAFSGKEIISLYKDHPNVYSQEEWRSDGWDSLRYGRDFDFSRSFFEQFSELQRDVPRMALITVDNENSGFTTGTGYCKNCYLINSSENCEDCYYGKLLQKCTSSVDCSYLYNSELCYECFSVYDSYHCLWTSFSQNCSDCLFSSGLKGCTHCFLCTNLANKEYHFLNEPLDQKEYEKRVAEVMGSAEKMNMMKKKYLQLMEKMPRKYANILNCQNCTGDYIEHSKNCFDCYDVNGSEDCRHVQVGVEVKDVYDCSNMYLKTELCYETLGVIEVYNVAYCLFVFHSQNLLYCDYCFHCKDCFGCSGLTHKQYCVFNTQYSKEEYEELVPKIIEHMKKNGEWGLYFPPEYSPFGYNESLASEYQPLEKDEALKRGYRWRDEDEKDFQVQTAELPDRISDATDALTQEIFACEATGKNYRIIPQELAFYRSQRLPLPRRCPDQRHRDRMSLRNPRTLFERTCAKCSLQVHSTFPPENQATLYCEKCYQQEVY